MSVTRRLRRPHTGSKLNGSSVSGFNATSWASSRRTASNSKGCFRAPSGLTDSEKSDNGDNGSPRYGFGPAISHIMRLSSVIPSYEFNKIWLHRQDLAEPVLKILLATPIPIVSRIDVLELEWRYTHQESLSRGMSGCE